jgi:hypothetical protein
MHASLALISFLLSQLAAAFAGAPFAKASATVAQCSTLHFDGETINFAEILIRVTPLHRTQASSRCSCGTFAEGAFRRK